MLIPVACNISCCPNPPTQDGSHPFVATHYVSISHLVVVSLIKVTDTITVLVFK